MSAQATGWVWKHSPLRGSKLLVHLAIADVVNDAHGNEFWMHNKNLALKAHVSDGTVDEALAALKQMGMLEVLTQGGGRGNPTRYRMVMCQTAQNLGGSEGEKPPNPRHETAQSAEETAQSTGTTPITNPIDPNSSQANEDEDLAQQVVERIVASRCAGKQMHNPREYRNAVRAEVMGETWDTLLRIIDLFPGAPQEMYAAYALGEPAPYLSRYRRPDPP